MLVETGAEDGVIEGAQDDIEGVELDFLAPFYYARPGTIYGGSSEIQRNILVEVRSPSARAAFVKDAGWFLRKPTMFLPGRPLARSKRGNYARVFTTFAHLAISALM